MKTYPTIGADGTPGPIDLAECFEWIMGMERETRESCLRLLRAAHPRTDYEEVTLTITPRVGFGAEQVGESVTMRQLVPVQGGAELLGHVLRKMMREVVMAKAGLEVV
jgi:hypothetical protein